MMASRDLNPTRSLLCVRVVCMYVCVSRRNVSRHNSVDLL